MRRRRDQVWMGDPAQVIDALLKSMPAGKPAPIDPIRGRPNEDLLDDYGGEAGWVGE